MKKLVLFRWKTFFSVCTVILTVLIVFYWPTWKSTISKFNLQMAKKSNSKNQSAISACLPSDELSPDVKKTSMKNCSVSVFTSTNEEDYYSRNSTCPVCTSALFKEYYRNHSSFISDGYWDVLTSGNKIFRSATFSPSFCSFTGRNLDSNFIKECFSRRRVRKIVTFGDSNGRRTFFGLKVVLAEAGINQCELVKVENDDYFTNISYYLPVGTYTPSGYVSSANRACHSCNARQFRCYYENKDLSGLRQNTTLIIEHLPLSRIIDSSVRIVKPIAGFKPTNYTQEFLFRDYLGLTGQPDIVIIATPFLHEVRAKLERHGKVGLKGMIRKLVTILQKYLPRSTHVYWVPSHYVFGGTELSEVSRCNQDLYEALKAEVGAVENNMHGTLDLLSLSCPLVDLSLKDDPYHMQPKWYEVIGKHLLELICN